MMGKLELALTSFSMYIILVGATCPPDFENHGSRCYKIVDEEASWIEAKMYCRVFGADLAVIESQAEEDILEGMVRKLHGSARNENYWIDGADLLSEGEWRWMGKNGKSRVISGYKNWVAGQPDNYDGLENCMHLYYGHGFDWNDSHCKALFSFICESGHIDEIPNVIG